MNFCGYDYVTISDEKKLFFLSDKKNKTKKNHRKNKNKKNNDNTIKKDPNSPFAVLEKLL